MLAKSSFRSAQTIFLLMMKFPFICYFIVYCKLLLETTKLYLFSYFKRNLRKAKYLQKCEPKILVFMKSLHCLLIQHNVWKACGYNDVFRA